ncbi:hypothetical protein CLOM_g3841 [Closterium sp. NIES-68]|nr:hypothetical protein CLOM_g3841 [Closterium sp. NIES-68]GJP68155.1 hypothetical protein CLOP_g24894 [Closterium sp. NIES-67]
MLRVENSGLLYSGASARQTNSGGMAMAHSVRHSRRFLSPHTHLACGFHSAVELSAPVLSASGSLAASALSARSDSALPARSASAFSAVPLSAQGKGPVEPARPAVARAAGADGLFDGERFVLTLEVTDDKQAQAKDVLASGWFRATVAPDLPAPAGIRELLEIPLSLLPRSSSSSSSSSPPITHSLSPPLSSLTLSSNSPDEIANSQATPLTACAGNPSSEGSKLAGQAIAKDPDSSVAAQVVAQVLTVAAQVKRTEAVRQQMVERAAQVAGGREGSTPGALLLLSGAHPTRSWPLLNRLLPTNSLRMLQDAHRLRAAGQIPRFLGCGEPSDCFG